MSNDKTLINHLFNTKPNTNICIHFIKNIHEKYGLYILSPFNIGKQTCQNINDFPHVANLIDMYVEFMVNTNYTTVFFNDFKYPSYPPDNFRYFISKIRSVVNIDLYFYVQSLYYWITVKSYDNTKIILEFMYIDYDNDNIIRKIISHAGFVKFLVDKINTDLLKSENKFIFKLVVDILTFNET
jgi:hypothetical protein